MRTDRSALVRSTALLLSLTGALASHAQDDGAQQVAPGAPLFHVDNSLLYALIALAVVQVIFIVSLSSILRALGGTGTWAKRLGGNGGRALMSVPLLLLTAQHAQAQAYADDAGTLSTYQTFWWLLGTNILLFIILLVQIGLVRTVTRVVTGRSDEPLPARSAVGPTALERLVRRLTRQVPAEQERNILMHHSYDGIHELDNVLPPWWVWLFYGTIIWSVVYLVNVHVIKIWPDQRTEYVHEMDQARTDIAAYMATLSNTVDENTVQQSTDAAVLASGRNIFKQNCTPCHGADAAGSETSVGPNLTDAYWLHGGGVKNIFHTISYGVPEKGMISWKAQLKPVEIASLASYVLSLQGTGGATQKAPQGDRWQEPATPADSTTSVKDTVPITADTARMAVR